MLCDDDDKDDSKSKSKLDSVHIPAVMSSYLELMTRMVLRREGKGVSSEGFTKISLKRDNSHEQNGTAYGQVRPVITNDPLKNIRVHESAVEEGGVLSLGAHYVEVGMKEDGWEGQGRQVV